MYVTEDGQKFKSKSQAEFHEKELADKVIFDKWELPLLGDDTKYGDPETAYSLLSECLRNISVKLSEDNVDEVKKVLSELSFRID